MSCDAQFSEQYSQYMQAAIRESYKARGISSPNPPVGAVIYDSEGILRGYGHTYRPGEMHAEVAALQQAGDFAKDGTLVVTLEPCNHYGRTPPCVQAILDAGISTVIYGVPDSTSWAHGGGRYLEQAGITVISGVEKETIRQGPLREWLFRQEHGRPHISAKIAMSLDGKVATALGERSWLTQMPARMHAHKIRSELDAIVVGTSTVLIDNPQLTARLPEKKIYEHQPLRVIVGNRVIPNDYYVHDGSVETRFIPRCLPSEIIAELGDYNNILIEGGPRLIHQFIQYDLIDRYHIYIAPIIVGKGIDAFIDMPREIDTSLELKSGIHSGWTHGSNQRIFPQNFIPSSVEQLGDDIYLTLLHV